jgi:hypothetical protein
MMLAFLLHGLAGGALLAADLLAQGGGIARHGQPFALLHQGGMMAAYQTIQQVGGGGGVTVLLHQPGRLLPCPVIEDDGHLGGQGLRGADDTGQHGNRHAILLGHQAEPAAS